jgi:cytochrome c553
MLSLNPAQRAYEARMAKAAEKRAARKVERAKRKLGGLARPKPQTIASEHRGGADVWHRMPWLQVCEVCHGRPADHAHHILREQALRRFAGIYGFDFQVARFDVRNRFWICERCHSRHHTAAARIPLDALPGRAFEFACEIGLNWLLDREYASRGANAA